MNRRASAVFLSHASPLAALERDGYTDAVRALGAAEHPAAVVVVSAHWVTGRGVAVTGGERQHAIHDFGGFPDELHRLRYDVPGSPGLAAEVVARIGAAGLDAGTDRVRGIDHGVWIPMMLAWPRADVPVVQVSLPVAPPGAILALGRALRPLRDEGVMILGSGGLVHNLMMLQWDGKDAPPAPWAREFDAWMAERVAARDLESLLEYEERAPHAARAAPTDEHLVPLFVALGAARDDDRIDTIFEGFQYGSLGLRSLALRATQ